MSTPSPDIQGAAADADTEGTNDIPRRLMRVKVLYTFDDQNKSNCLARLPNALSIPTVSLDETTQLGVIELKTCIQAIVSASPELVAKLGHDYTVYAYDYSEYETPLVGQGMLSWILASASTTPNAPAEESQTMVTGRVCKNILGLFSNGIKETLEVKLKLVPVPTCMQSEYVENMERYHSLSKIMPEGMDYKEWAEFLKANPDIGQLAQPASRNTARMTESISTNAIESFNDLMNNSFYGQRHMSFSTHDTRASSPAMSTVSLYPYQTHSEFRPASRASFHSESAAHSPYYPPATDPNLEPAEDGPPKKRARVTKAKRPKKTALGPNFESLRVTASTAASVRLHRPVPLNASTAVSAEQVPRAPTPRPRNTGMLQNGSHIPAPSLLRNASTDEGRSYMSPYDSGIFSDNALDSADDDRGDSPSDTPPNMPSSPPLLPEHVASPAPSSPELPMLPPPNDSGFASDMLIAQNEEGTGRGSQACEKGDGSVAPEVRIRKKQDRSKRPWSEINPGPSNLLPTSEIRRDRLGPSRRQPESTPIDPGLLNHFLSQMGTTESQKGISQSIEIPVAKPDLPPREAAPSNRPTQDSRMGPSPPTEATVTMTSIPQTGAIRIGTPSYPLPAPKAARGLARSQTWSGEPMSDPVGPDEGKAKQPRSGSGAKRQTKVLIKERLEKAITKGQLPTFCNNCGQIETPAWRKAYTRVEIGIPQNIELSSKGNAIVAYEVMDPAENEGAPHYRIFKNDLAPEEVEANIFTTLILCNPCGLWLIKKNAMRPQTIWGRSRTLNSADKPKKARKPKKTKADHDLFTSDAVIPESDSGIFDARIGAEAPCALDGATDTQMQPPLRTRSESVRAPESSKLDEPTARAALERAFQSSPVGVRIGSKDSPINVDGDLTPKPTRRLLFPSPRRPGEVKSLADSNSHQPLSPRSTPSKTAKPPVQHLDAVLEEGDKENCPPPVGNEDDDLAHLFESPKITPPKGSSFEDLLKTPTPGSRQRIVLTPIRHAEVNLTTPSRSSRTPRGNGKATTLAPETPFTRQLNDLLSDSMLPGSPSQNFDISAFTTFNTPGRNSILHFGDFLQNDSLSSDLPIPSSSPPKNFDFSVFEDPNTSTVGLWSGASIFDVGDTIMSDALVDDQPSGAQDGSAPPKILTIHGIGLDFPAMIEEVVGSTSPEEREATSLVPVPAAPSQSRRDPVPLAAQKCEHPPIPVPGEYDPPKPRCQRCKQRKKGCDRQRPCGRCVKAGLGAESCVPVDEEAATSPAFSASTETVGHVQRHAHEQPHHRVVTPSIPVDPALEANMAPAGSKIHEVNVGVKQEVITPKATELTMDHTTQTARAADRVSPASASIPEAAKAT